MPTQKKGITRWLKYSHRAGIESGQTNAVRAEGLDQREGMMDTTIQYWLAELDQYGNPTLIDGAHSSMEEVNRAAYLITAMSLGKPNRQLAIAKVELSECKPSAAGVNLEAVRTINSAKERMLRKR